MKRFSRYSLLKGKTFRIPFVESERVAILLFMSVRNFTYIPTDDENELGLLFSFISAPKEQV
ncbi:hypothetical protein [Sigmofec virus UA08Rod_4686]|uniref:Uncharacterized protein n=1 Tax=Sigmofec virus UA08Rod_4686 TaxID=2929406 RepID=A0A976N1Q2_9VIRU|nr:hypothetical protein [Sigmofec virus UA08Rod_4686]